MAIVNEKTCAGCIFNKEENDCKRNLDWQWKGDTFPLSKGEYESVKAALKTEMENAKSNEDGGKLHFTKEDNKTFHEKLR